MRIGLHTGTPGKGDNAIDQLVAAAREAGERGLAFWMPQMSDVDALTVLAVIGREVPGVELGTAVVPTYPRHPMMLASQALTVQAASQGRLTLGIGLSHKVVIEGAFGLSYAKPVRHLREYLEVLMPLLHTGRVAVDGEEYQVHSFRSGLFPGAVAPSVLVAALGTQMLNVAGRLADGTSLWMVGPRTIESHIVPTITAAASAAGRPAPRIAAGLPVSVTSDIEGARERAAKAFGFYDTLPSYRAMLDKEGADGPVDVAIIGDEETVTAGLRRLADVGVTDFTLPVFGTPEDRTRTLDLLQSLAADTGNATAPPAGARA
jgi:5,10-methylenetetrahydromethanopterin reductase